MWVTSHGIHSVVRLRLLRIFEHDEDNHFIGGATCHSGKALPHVFSMRECCVRKE